MNDKSSTRQQIVRHIPEGLVPVARRLERIAIRAVRVVLPRKYPVSSKERMMVNVGCGSFSNDDFVNVDANPGWNIHHFARVDRRLPFKTGTVDLLYASHVLEHISWKRTPEVVAEWVRVLRPGGMLRIAVPDFDALYEYYKLSDLPTVLPYLAGGQDYFLNTHLAFFNEQLLRKLMEDAGCRDIRRWKWGESKETSLPDSSRTVAKVGEKTVQISLNLEGRKRQ